MPGDQTYGFLTEKSPSLQLQTLLKLDNNDDIFQTLKTKIISLAEKYVDVKHVASVQRKKLDLVETKLKELYPDIFATEESDKRLFFAIRLVFFVHARRRHLLKRTEQRRDPIPPTSQIMQSRHPPSTPRSRITRSRQKDRQSQLDTPELASDHESKRHNLVVNHRMPQSAVCQTLSRPNECPTDTMPHVNQQNNQQSQLDARTDRESKPHNQLVDNHGMQSAVCQTLSQSNECRPMDAISPPAVTPSISNCKIQCPNQYRAIYDFLEASLPPMTHFMDGFIDYGCINVDFLLAISAWPFERIRYFLDQVPGRDGTKMTDMEKFVLQNHFKEYFV